MTTTPAQKKAVKNYRKRQIKKGNVYKFYIELWNNNKDLTKVLKKLAKKKQMRNFVIEAIREKAIKEKLIK